MVREIVYSRPFEHCKVKDFFEILYADGEAAIDFHREADKDENAQVETWQGNTRTVNFTMPMQIPAVIAKIIRTSKIPVKEIQRVETDEDGALHITSTPYIGVPGGDKFVAVAKLFVSNTSSGCTVEAKVVCTAQGPFGLKGMIEGIMVEQSAASVRTYIAFCHKRCQAKLSESAELANGSASPRSDSTVFEQFFDAQEVLSRSASMASMASDSAQAQAAADELINTAAVLRLIDSLDGRLDLLSSDLAALRALLPASPGPSTAAPGPHASPGKGERGLAWFTGFSLGAACATCIFVVGLRKNLFNQH